MNILIKSAIIIDTRSPFHLKKRDILVEKGVITNISPSIDSLKGFKEIKFSNLHISNGWFDTSVSFGEPGFEQRETIAKGLDTAAKSGFTSVAINSNVNPIMDNKSVIELIKKES